MESKSNLFGLEEAPTFYPSDQDFVDPYKYIHSIYSIGEKYGICKIVPPDNWNPPFCIDQVCFLFFLFFSSDQIKSITFEIIDN